MHKLCTSVNSDFSYNRAGESGHLTFFLLPQNSFEDIFEGANI